MKINIFQGKKQPCTPHLPTAAQGSGPPSMSSVTTLQLMCKAGRGQTSLGEGSSVRDHCPLLNPELGRHTGVPYKPKTQEQGMAPVKHLARGDQAPLKPTGVLVVQ